MIAFAATQGWDYRLRLKGNLSVFIDGRKSRLDQHATGKLPYLHDVQLTHRRVTTNIGIINDPGHDEPWFIAMSDKPGYLTTLDYSGRWGIEPMLSDFKSRGFGLEGYPTVSNNRKKQARAPTKSRTAPQLNPQSAAPGHNPIRR